MQAGTIALILNIVFVVILILGFLLGMWRGVKKASINLVFSLVGVIVAFFCCGAITGAVMNISVTVNGEPSTIGGFLASLFNGNADIQHLIEANPNIEKLIANLPYAICNVIVFIVFALAVEFVMYILYKIFSAIFVKKKDKEGNKLPKRRIAGGVVGVIKTAAVGLLMMMPLVSLIGTASDLTNTSNDIYAEQVEQNNSANGLLGGVMPNEALQVIDGLNTSAFGVIGNMFGLDNVMFDYLSSFKLDDETVYIRQEIANYNDVYSTAMQLKLIFEGKTDKKFTNINFDKLDLTINNLLTSPVYSKVVSGVLDSLIVNYDEYSFINAENLGDFYPIFQNVSSAVATYAEGAGEYLAHDLRNIYGAYKELAKSGALDKAIGGKNVEEILSTISSEYPESLSKGIYNLLTTNIVKDSTASVVDLLVSKIIDEADKVSVNGRELTDEDFKELSNSITNVVKNYSEIAKNVDLISLMDDPLALLSEESDIEIVKTFSSLGSLIDDVRGIKIFQTSDGKSVMDKLLTGNGFELPTEEVVDKEGNSVSITNYTELMNFISPSLQSLKDIKVYNLLKAETVQTSDILITFANAAKTDNDILSDIILPLYQVEPTKTLLISELLNTLDKSIINFEKLETYDDWKSDLGYISEFLVTLNKGSVNGKTYLQVMFEKSANTLLTNLGEDITVTDIMKPMLYAKSTNGLMQDLFNSFEEVFNSLVFGEGSSSSLKFDFTKVTLVEGDKEDQNAEICKVFETFVNFLSDYENGAKNIEDLDKIKLGKFLDAMKENAYRETLSDGVKTKTGLFKVGFVNLIEKVKESYKELATITDYAHTDFTQLFTELANASQGA